MRKVIIIGGGRMGSLIANEIKKSDDLDLIGVYDIDNVDELDNIAPVADVAIDFSAPAALQHVAAYVRRTGAALVSGTTGLDGEGLATMEALGEYAPVVHASNYSLGVAVLRKVSALAAEALDGWDIEIVETHHNKKVDAPSGTAKALLEAVDPAGEQPVVHGREGIVGARPTREIGIHALRGGTVAGTHEVHFFGADEEVCLTHRATSRIIFVRGALACARRLIGKEPGFHTFDDVMFD